jgi:hypothetical protein
MFNFEREKTEPVLTQAEIDALKWAEAEKN